MGRKKGERSTVLIRIYEDNLEAIRQAAGERNLTIAELIDQHAMPCIAKAHRDYIKAEAKKLGDGDQ
jgi:hypothetical protein